MATKSATSKTKPNPETQPPSEADAIVMPVAAMQTAVTVQLKKKEFFDRVIERSGLGKGEAKTAIEAALAVLGEALAAGEEVNLPPLGKIRVTRQKDTPRGIAYNLRLVRNRVEDGSNAPLADRGEDS